MKNNKVNKIDLLKSVQGDYNTLSLCSIKHVFNEFEFINKTTNKVEKAKLKIKYLPDLDRLVSSSLFDLIDSFSKEKTDFETAVEEIFDILFEFLSPVELKITANYLKNEKVNSKIKLEYCMYDNFDDEDEDEDGYFEDEDFDEDDLYEEDELDNSPILSLFNTDGEIEDKKDIESEEDLLPKKDKSKNSKKPKK
ncbi:MAG: hypothetical protein V1773_11110 [bacterium]